MHIHSHTTVYWQPGTFAGWPANHGAWQWGNEFLVGFMTGPYQKVMRGHHIGKPYTKLFARSVDGGESWTTETPNVNFNAEVILGPAPKFPLKGDTIIRVCGVYDTGGETCFREGGFYLSHDRGLTWIGPYALTGTGLLFRGKFECSARMCVVGDLVFLTNKIIDNFGTDQAFVFKWTGDKFQYRGTISSDNNRSACPAAAAIGTRLVAVLRRMGVRDYWLEAFVSENKGVTWQSSGIVYRMRTSNGNPPALIETNGVLVCAWGDRDDHTIKAALSTDGYNWRLLGSIRAGGKSDIGYPQLFRRQDSSLVCVYYWAHPGEEQHIEATRFSI